MELIFMARSAGILLSITSLPSPYGIGTIGKEARKFADFLKASGQTIWQILPVGPTSYGDSPYQSFSTYAGNPYLIDLDTLCDEGLVTKEQLDSFDWGSPIFAGKPQTLAMPTADPTAERMNPQREENIAFFL